MRAHAVAARTGEHQRVSSTEPTRQRSRGHQNEISCRTAASAVDYRDLSAAEDSDDEQHHLLEYAGGVSNATPLTDSRSAKSSRPSSDTSRPTRSHLRNSGLERDTLSEAEREYAHGAVAAALGTYRNDYLKEVRNVLEAEQYILLSSYETTEFNRELERLQMTINAK